VLCIAVVALSHCVQRVTSVCSLLESTLLQLARLYGVEDVSQMEAGTSHKVTTTTTTPTTLITIIFSEVGTGQQYKKLFEHQLASLLWRLRLCRLCS
jgi:hypothetical protein